MPLHLFSWLSLTSNYHRCPCFETTCFFWLWKNVMDEVRILPLAIRGWWVVWRIFFVCILRGLSQYLMTFLWWWSWSTYLHFFRKIVVSGWHRLPIFIYLRGKLIDVGLCPSWDRRGSPWFLGRFRKHCNSFDPFFYKNNILFHPY